MKISICIATYNGSKYIVEQLESIINNLSGIEHEIIISDDGSNDETLKLIQSIRYPYIRVLEGPKKGLIKNFENALMHASGEFIFLSDQDDVWLPGKATLLLNSLNSCDLVVGDARVVNEKLETLVDSFFLSRHSGNGIFKNLYKNTYLGCCMAFNKHVLDAALPFPEKLPMHDWWLGLIGESVGRVCFLNKPTVLYRRHGNNASDTAEVSTSKLLTQINWRLQIVFSLVLRSLDRKLSKTFRKKH